MKKLTVHGPSGLCLLQEAWLEQYPELVQKILAKAQTLNQPLGWHYLLDLIWILTRLDLQKGAKVLDAGGGYGLLQYLLADLGYQVTSVDREARHQGLATKGYYNVKYHMPSHDQPSNGLIPFPYQEDLPTLTFHQSELTDLKFIESDYFDAVVSVSAIEHNPAEKVKLIMAELERVAKSQAPMYLTISVDDPPSYHKASNSYLLDEFGVREAYALGEPYESDFDLFGKTLMALKNSEILRRHLDPGYKKSGKNGMPWGRWDPKYVPAGVFKVNTIK